MVKVAAIQKMINEIGTPTDAKEAVAVNTGNHVLKIYAIDPALVLQKIVIETEEGKVLELYLGPPESFRKE